MAKKGSKKKKTRTVYRTKKRGAPKRDATPLAASAGMALTGAYLLVNREGGNNSPVDIMRGFPKYSLQGTIEGTVDGLVRNAMQPKVWYPVIGGALISASPNIPVVKIIAKKADKAIKKMSHKKVGL